jgi:D-sedoheptulose 7-phosphate isomerase
MSVTDYVRLEMVKANQMIDQMIADDFLIATIERVGQICADAVRSGGKVMFCGNGGSAGDCQHLAAEMVGKLVFDRPGMAGLALTTDTSALTAIGNDFGYEHVFSRQVEGLGRVGDVLIGISTSGQSKNVVAAMVRARSMGIRTVAMTGRKPGPMADLADAWIAVPHHETQKIQEGHIVIGHIFCALVEDAVFGTTRSAV